MQSLTFTKTGILQVKIVITNKGVMNIIKIDFVFSRSSITHGQTDNKYLANIF